MAYPVPTLSDGVLQLTLHIHEEGQRGYFIFTDAKD